MAAVCFGTDTYECDFATVNATMESYFRMTCDQAPPKPPWYIYLGIGLGCFGSVGINLGNNLRCVGVTPFFMNYIYLTILVGTNHSTSFESSLYSLLGQFREIHQDFASFNDVMTSFATRSL